MFAIRCQLVCPLTLRGACSRDLPTAAGNTDPGYHGRALEAFGEPRLAQPALQPTLTL